MKLYRLLAVIAGISLVTGCAAKVEEPVVEEPLVEQTRSDLMMTEADLVEVNEGLASGNRATIQQLTGMTDDVELSETEFNALIDELETVEFHSETLATLEEGVSSVEGRTSTGEWIFYLVHHDDQWVIAYTGELP